MILGHLRVGDYLRRVKGQVVGAVLTDAKNRRYRQTYQFADDGDKVVVQRADARGDAVPIPKSIELDEALVGFLGLYSGDGAKGTEDVTEDGRIIPVISFSQREKHLVRFAVDQFRRIFPGAVRFAFSLGEDAAYFMAGPGRDMLEAYYRAERGIGIPGPVPLSVVRPVLDEEDEKYLGERRPDVEGANKDYLAFYYQHKSAMGAICKRVKESDLTSVGIDVRQPDVTVTASLRRPFKKGAREPGGSSRSDELRLGGVGGLGELFFKMMHEVEDSILKDSRTSSSGLVEWLDRPSSIGQVIDLKDFFSAHPYGQINKAHPIQLAVVGEQLVGKWGHSSETTLARYLRIDPLWCYVAGLYLAEGRTSKDVFFRMFSNPPGSMGVGFTSSEGTSIELVLRTLRKLFSKDACVDAWKVKVGSQYFPELVVIGLKHGVPMLRGGESGEGKLRTMEISLSIKDWALDVADAPLADGVSLLRRDYADRYSHVEATGAGVARIDFWASSKLGRWYFPLLMYAIFGSFVADPTQAFYQ